MMDVKSIKQMVEEIGVDEQVQLVDIPDIDLYMDQVITFIERNLAHLKRNEKDKLLTKTMINNYTKAGLLKAPVKKKYSRRQIATLLMIYESKQVLSMNDIGQLLKPLVHSQGEAEKRDALFDRMYTLSREINNAGECGLEEICIQQMNAIQDQCQTLETDNRETMEWFLLANSLLARAAREKRLAERIIERYISAENSGVDAG